MLIRPQNICSKGTFQTHIADSRGNALFVSDKPENHEYLGL
jgi:hypothetical protein